MTVSKALIKADRWIDHYGPTTVNNGIDLIMKVGIAAKKYFSGACVFYTKGSISGFGEYYKYIEDKSTLKCLIGLIPVLGNIAFWLIDYFNGEDSNPKPTTTIGIVRTESPFTIDSLEESPEEVFESDFPEEESELSSEEVAELTKPRDAEISPEQHAALLKELEGFTAQGSGKVREEEPEEDELETFIEDMTRPFSEDQIESMVEAIVIEEIDENGDLRE